MMVFNMSTSLFFTKISFHYFEGYVMTKTALTVTYIKKEKPN